MLNSAGSQAHELRFGSAGRDGFANLETPFPQARLNLREGEINAPMVHDLRDGDTLFASSSVSNFKITRWMYLSMPFSIRTSTRPRRDRVCCTGKMLRLQDRNPGLRLAHSMMPDGHGGSSWDLRRKNCL